MRVAYFGAPGAFGEEAAASFGGEGAVRVACGSFARVVEEVEQGRADAGVLPMENSRAGMIPESFDLLRRPSLHVLAELDVRVRHCLLAPPGTPLAALTHAHSHPQALAQTKEFLERHRLTPVPENDTASAARRVAEGRAPGAAAIASRAAGLLLGLEVVAEGIETDPDNTTRFWVLGREPRSAEGLEGAKAVKTALLFEPLEEPGSLARALSCLSEEGVALRALHTRPAEGGAFAPVVFISADGAASAPALSRAVALLEERTRGLRVLGTFRSARSGASF